MCVLFSFMWGYEDIPWQEETVKAQSITFHTPVSLRATPFPHITSHFLSSLSRLRMSHDSERRARLRCSSTPKNK